METIPLLIQRYSERISKDVSAFTGEDWRNLAIEAVSEINALEREIAIFERKLPPPLGKPGRPRKHPRKSKNIRFIGGLNFLNPENWEHVKPKRGRSPQKYYGLPIKQLNDLILDIGKHPSAPKGNRELIKFVLKRLRNKVGGYADIGAVERALRRYRADTIKNNLG